MGTPFEYEITEQLSHLTPGQQQDVLQFVRSLNTPVTHGTRGRDLLKFAGSIPHEDIEAMKAAIEEGCEQVDFDGW